MKALTYAVWIAALVVLACGLNIAARNKREVENSAVSARTPGHQALTRRADPEIDQNGKSSRPAPSTSRSEKWSFTNDPTVQRKDPRIGNALPYNAEARAAESGIRVRLRYHAFYSANGLSREEISRFEKAMAGKMDPFSNIVGMSPQEDAATRESLARRVDNIVRETLGEPFVAKMREFIATADLREVADKLAVNTFHTETPLTGAQAERFVQVCLACRTAPGNGIRNLPEAVDWDMVQTQVQSFLTPSQLDVLRIMTDMRRFDREFKQSTGLPYRSPVRNF